MVTRILGAVGKLFIGAGVVILAFVAFQLWGTGLEEASGQDQLGQSFASSAGVKDAGDAGDALEAVTKRIETSTPSTTAPLPPAEVGQAVGAIVIPKIGLEKFFVEGTDKASLKKGPGHYEGTPMPGQPGNAAIAGHRTTYGAPFNRIDELVPGDRIETYTLQGKFVYEVVAPPERGIEHGPGWWTVLPTQGEVIGPLDDGQSTLTLTACHPKYSARQRIIVRARMVTAPTPAPAPAPAETPKPAPRATSTHDKAMDEALSGDSSALWPALGFAGAALLVLGLAWSLGRRFGHRVVAYALATPGICVLMWFCFVWTDRWLPAI